VICISHNTKADLVRLNGIAPGKTAVIHLGIDQHWAESARTVAGLPEAFVLFVGKRASYKNFSALLDSMGRLARRYPDIHLICVGGGAFTASEIAAISALSLKYRIQQRDLNDDELAYCYRNARAFVFPSLYEGFGLPILESFVSRCPLILTNRSCFPEIAEDAAEYFDPDVPQSLDRALERVLDDRDYRQALIDRGAKRASNFTRSATAVRTAATYREVLR
jgi:glycosyltransferase involved in cell wall biosynthesis